MAAFSERPLCYQAGMLLLLAGTAVFAVGVALPWWAQTRARGSEVVTSHSGLWLGCTSSSSSPSSSSSSLSSSAGEERCTTIDAPGWFQAVQVLQGLSLGGMLVASVHAVFTNCCLDHASFSRTMEAAAGAGGLLGVVSGVLYVVKTFHVLGKGREASYSWAFALDLGACILVTLTSASLALTHTRHHYYRHRHHHHPLNHHPDPDTHHEPAGPVIVEEGGNYYRPAPNASSRKPPQWEMEMTAVHTPRSPEASRPLVVNAVLQTTTQYPTPQRLSHPDCALPSSPPAPLLGGTPSPRSTHVCHPSRINGVASVPGMATGSASARCLVHGRVCEAKSTSCLPGHSCACQSDFTKGCSCMKSPVGKSSTVPCSIHGDPKQISGCWVGCNCGASPLLLQLPESCLCCHQRSLNEKGSPGMNLDLEGLPRAVASAPPLSLQDDDQNVNNYTIHHTDDPQNV